MTDAEQLAAWGTPADRYAAYIRGSHPDAAPMWDAADVRGWADAAERYAATLRARGVNDTGYRDLIAQVRQNPDGYYLSNGSAVKKPMSSAKAIGLGAAYLGGLSAIGAAMPSGATGTLGSLSSAAAPTITPAATVGTAGAVGMPAQVIGAGINAGASIYGANRQNAANNRAAQASERGAESELAFLREQEAERRRQWEADQQFQAQKWAADEEERAFRRRIAESDEADRVLVRQREQERETRRAPYRAASEAALGRLGTLLSGQGHTQWRSPSNVGRGTLGSMVGR